MGRHLGSKNKISKKIEKNCIDCNSLFCIYPCEISLITRCQNCILKHREKKYKTCPECNKVFILKNKNIVYCSLRCSHLKQIPWNKGLKGYRAGRRKLDSELKTDRLKKYDTKYTYWMLSIKKRDNWKCKINNQDCKGNLEAHHILSWRDYQELRYDINNGITLCHAHHPRKRIDEAKLSPFFQRIVAEMK
jgi:hypothetical protein